MISSHQIRHIIRNVTTIWIKHLEFEEEKWCLKFSVLSNAMNCKQSVFLVPGGIAGRSQEEPASWSFLKFTWIPTSSLLDALDPGPQTEASPRKGEQPLTVIRPGGSSLPTLSGGKKGRAPPPAIYLYLPVTVTPRPLLFMASGQTGSSIKTEFQKLTRNTFSA